MDKHHFCLLINSDGQCYDLSRLKIAHHPGGGGVRLAAGTPAFRLFSHCHNIVNITTNITQRWFVQCSLVKNNGSLQTDEVILMEELRQELQELINKLDIRQLRYLIAFVKVYFKI